MHASYRAEMHCPVFNGRYNKKEVCFVPSLKDESSTWCFQVLRCSWLFVGQHKYSLTAQLFRLCFVSQIIPSPSASLQPLISQAPQPPDIYILGQVLLPLKEMLNVDVSHGCVVKIVAEKSSNYYSCLMTRGLRCQGWRAPISSLVHKTRLFDPVFPYLKSKGFCCFLGETLLWHNESKCLQLLCCSQQMFLL